MSLCTDLPLWQSSPVCLRPFRISNIHMSRQIDTIVIGAGWAGAVAARRLAQKGRKVIIVEARDRIGGRARTYEEGMHAPVDLGCSWIHGYKEGNPTKGIAKELGTATHLSQPTESVIYDQEGRLTQAATTDLQSSLSKTHAAARSYARDTPASSISASTSLASFFFNSQSSINASPAASSAKSLARMLEIPFGVELERVSLRWTGWEDNFAGSDAAPEGGFQRLVEKVVEAATETGNAEVKLGETVNIVVQEYAGVKVATNKGATYKAKTVLCTIPLGVLKQRAATLFEPALPKRRTEVIEGTHVGVLEKLCLVYEQAWWPDAATVGSFTFLPTKSSAEDSAASVLDANTIVAASYAAPSLPKPHPTVFFYLSPSPALGLAPYSLEEVTSAAHDFLVRRIQPAITPPPPSASVRTEWHKDPLSLGATTTPSIIGEGRGPLDFAELGKPLWDGRLAFAGEHTEMNHRGSVAGAVISGLREADRIHAYLDKLTS
ncbi:amine oxidase [Punctularia strigosozonata HHB-11173 SS5]|uniref:amine oxidase n=1 Tax=Punctularia strigosozonata (strain HHB-11173) TaxID=741275 RepID=UPI00044175BF|nr:amine oxidase [Punctularia strigosozonata HHB-11173 SS5]EIN11285.1 amine oxidase [Punctularia strigosozonata HHB-11173 SS5]